MGMIKQRLMKTIISIIISFFILTNAQSQEKYWVVFKNKKDVTFNPYEYFDIKAIERRIKHNIPLCDSTDYPLNAEYKTQVNIIVDEITSETRWFNAVAVRANQEQINTVSKLSFVESVFPIIISTYTADYSFDTISDASMNNLIEKQTSRMGAKYFAKRDITGKGVRIAIFDGGFPTVDVNPAFEHVRKNNRIIKTYDFTKKQEFAYTAISHGTNVMSNICGIVNNKKLGLATNAEFLLARTEVKAEPFSEEENWLAAVEWADKNGADIINSSLGYTFHRYFTWQMDGRSLVAKAGNLAAKKGMLVVNAAGNDGAGKWKYLGTPADADSVLTVGGISPTTDYHINFSSYGPTADKRPKPNVCAYGDVIVAGETKLKNVQGTSFSSPLVAGFAACVLELRPSLTNMELMREIEKSADLYPYFDYAHGYGVPQAEYFIYTEKEPKTKSFEFINENNEITIKVKMVSDKYLYYNIADKKGVIEKYAVLNVYQNKVISLSLDKITKGNTINVHYMGYTNSYICK